MTPRGKAMVSCCIALLGLAAGLAYFDERHREERTAKALELAGFAPIPASSRELSAEERHGESDESILVAFRDRTGVVQRWMQDSSPLEGRTPKRKGGLLVYEVADKQRPWNARVAIDAEPNNERKAVRIQLRLKARQEVSCNRSGGHYLSDSDACVFPRADVAAGFKCPDGFSDPTAVGDKLSCSGRWW